MSSNKKEKVKVKSKLRVSAREDAAKAELRELIIKTARETALENGFAALTIRKLAEKIGYAPGTIYLYFKDRDELVREICVRGFAELSEKIQLAAGATNPEKRLAALMHAYADFAVNNPETYRLSFMENPAFAAEMLRAAPLEAEDGPGRQAFSQIVQALNELKENGKLAKNENENLLAEALWAAVHGVVSLKLVYPAFPTHSTDALLNKIIETLIKTKNVNLKQSKFG